MTSACVGWGSEMFHVFDLGAGTYRVAPLLRADNRELTGFSEAYCTASVAVG